jgi:hypothetical protein
VKKLLVEIAWIVLMSVCLYMFHLLQLADPPWYIDVPCFLFLFWSIVICARKAYPDGVFGIK